MIKIGKNTHLLVVPILVNLNNRRSEYYHKIYLSKYVKNIITDNRVILKNINSLFSLST